MKHPEELKIQFLELRARGVSYGHIAEKLRVSKPTLIQWGKAMAEEIADLQAAERELVREKLLGNFEQSLGRQVHHFNRLDEEFGRREFKYSPTESVFRMMMASRKLLDRYFFEDDRPSQRRASERRAPSSPAAAAAPSRTAIDILPSDPKPDLMLQPSKAVTIHTATDPLHAGEGTGEGQTGNPASLSGAAETGSLAAHATSPGQDEGDSRSFSVAPPQPSADNALETRAYNENPAKTLPFPCQNSGGHNSALSPGDELDGEVLHEVSTPDSSPVSPPAASVETDLSPTRQINDPNHGNSGSGARGNSGPFPRLPRPQHALQPAVGRTVPSAPRTLPYCSADSKTENPNSKTPEPSEAETDFGGESVPINPFESTRQWLERQGIQVSKIPKGARVITAG